MKFSKIAIFIFLLAAIGQSANAQNEDGWRIVSVEETKKLKAIRDEFGEIKGLEKLFENRQHKNGLPFHVYIPKALKAGQKYPMVTFLHGHTDLTIDTHKGFPKGVWTLPEIQKANPHIVFVPRHRVKKDQWASDEYRAMTIKALDDLVAELNADPKTPNVDLDRLYLTGFSRGGQGTWNFIRTFPKKFAAAIPLSGFSHGPQNAKEAQAIKHIPTWIFNGDGDRGVKGSRISFKALKKAGAVDVRYHEYKSQGHVIDDFAYFTDGFMQWLFAQKRKPAAPVSHLKVYPDVPGLDPSPHYRFRVRAAGTDEPWQESFAFVTRCKKAVEGKNAYFSSLEGWTNTYTNFEMSGAAAIEVEIRKADGTAIAKAVPHPHGKAKACELRDGRVYVTIANPCLIAVDIDGQMDDQDTGLGPNGPYSGPPIHTVTVFANPPIEGRPDPKAKDVYVVKPGEKAIPNGDWNTLIFAPGVHDIGVGFPVHAGRSYYIPGDAIVYGTITNAVEHKGRDIRIFGYGTLSGAKISNPKFADPPPPHHSLHDPISISGARNTSVEGVTLADSAFHSLMLPAIYNPEEPTDIRWVKIFTWRANGDGINPFSNTLVEDCFIRTQDDSIYVNGRGIRRVVFWNDHNGSTFVLTAMPDDPERPVIVEDCDVIYARAGWNRWSGGRLFNMRGEGKGACGRGVVFRNIRVEDTRPTLQAFMIAMQGFQPYAKPSDRTRGPGALSGVLFQNIEIAAPSILGEPDILWGTPDAPIHGLTFDNVTIGGKTITEMDHFKHNPSVRDLRFK